MKLDPNRLEDLCGLAEQSGEKVILDPEAIILTDGTVQTHHPRSPQGLEDAIEQLEFELDNPE